MSFQLSRFAVKQVAPLLLRGLCTREKLIDFLSTLEYRDSPAAAAAREVDGYLILPERSVDVRVVGPLADAQSRLSSIARVHRLRGRKGSKQKDSLALEAILTGLLVPLNASLPDAVAMLANGSLLIPRNIYPSGRIPDDDDTRKTYIVRLSNRAVLGFARYGREEFDGLTRLSIIATRLATYRLTRAHDISPPAYPRKRHDMRVYPWVITHYASEGRRLGLTPASLGRGGVRTSLSVAGWTMELLGLGYLVPSHIIALENREPVEAGGVS